MTHTGLEKKILQANVLCKIWKGALLSKYTLCINLYIILDDNILLIYNWYKKKIWKGKIIKNVEKKGRVWHLFDSHLKISLEQRQFSKKTI